MNQQEPISEQIYRSSLKFLAPLTPEETYQLVVEEAIKLVNARYGSIFLMMDGELTRAYASDPRLYEVKVRQRGTTYTTFKERKAHVFNAEDLAKVHPQFKVMGVKSIISIPLANKNKSIGVLSIQSDKRTQFTNKEYHILKWFGSLAALAIRKTQLYDEVKTALEARDLFLSMAAHELRTPLTTINGYIQLLHSKLSGADTVESKWIEELSWESERLSLLINELLEVERIKTGQLKYYWKECSLKAILDRAIHNFRFSYPSHQLIFKDEINGDKDTIIGDFDKILQAITNLLENAAKFSPALSKITVTLKRKYSFLTITIHDQGSGIPKKDLPKIFTKFYRGNHAREGMGIGLFLVKNIIEQHKGLVKIRSKERKGTMAEIRLPKIKT